MRQCSAPLLLAVPVLALLGCTKPDIDFSRIRTGMTKAQVIGQVGNPTRVMTADHSEIFEYEAYDHYGAMRTNLRSQFVRFIDGRVESFGNKGDFDPAKAPAGGAKADRKAGADRQEDATRGGTEATAPVAFDLRTELEKLEKLRKDGLITDAEFKELRQRALARAMAQ